MIAFNIKDIEPKAVCAVFSKEGIIICAGHNSAMPLVNDVLGTQAVARVSFYVYNTKEDAEAAIDTIAQIAV